MLGSRESPRPRYAAYEEVGLLRRRGAAGTDTGSTAGTTSRGCASSSACGGSGWARRDAGRLARQCLERGAIDADLAPLLAEQRAAIVRQRADLDRLEAELLDLQLTMAAAGRATLEDNHVSERPFGRSSSARATARAASSPRRSSAGSAGPTSRWHRPGQPKGVNPYAVQVLAERRHRLVRSHQQGSGQFLDQPWDYVITVCDRARQACPVFPGQHNSLHWGLEDPAEVEGTDTEKLDAFERTAMELTQRLRPFVEVALRAAGRTRRATISG